MNYSSIEPITKAKLRAKKTASDKMVFEITEGGNTSYFTLDKEDKTSKDNDKTVIVGGGKLRFKKLKPFEFEEVPAEPTVYKSAAYTANCGEGYTGKDVVVKAGEFDSEVSQADADRKAKSYGDSKLVCTPVVVDPPPSGEGKRIQGFSTHTTKGRMKAGSDMLELDEPIAEKGDLLAVIIGTTPMIDVTVLEIISPKKVRISKTAPTEFSGAKVVHDSTERMFEHVRKTKKFDAAALGFDANDTLYFRRVKWEGQYWSPILKDWFYPTDITIDLGGMTFASIPGAFPCSFGVEYGNGEGNFLVKNGTIKQNGTAAELGNWWVEEQKHVPNIWLYCPAFGGWTRGAKAENIIVINPCAYAFYGGTVKDCGVKITDDGMKMYNGWPYVFCNIEDSWFESPYLIRAVEIEASTGTYVKNFRSVNGLFASNSSWDALFQNIDITLTEGAADGNPALLDNPMFEIHGHIKGAAGNITVDGLTVNYEGYLDDEGGLLKDFGIKDGVDGVLLKNITINKPPVLQPYGRGNGYGATIVSGAANLTIMNLTTNAKMGKGFEGGYSKDNAPMDIRGIGTKLINVKAEAAVLAKDAIVKDCKFDFPTKYVD